MLKTITTSDFLESNTLDKSKPIFFDIESEALYVNCSLMQLANEDGEIYMVTTNTNDEVEQMKLFLADCWLVGYNLSYDFGTLRFISKDTDDLFYAFKIARPQLQQFSLDRVAAYYNCGFYEGLDKGALQKKGFVRKAYLSQTQLKYAATDIEVLRRIWRDNEVQVIRMNNLAYKLAKYSLLETMAWQNTGMPLLLEKAEYYRNERQAQLETLEEELLQLVGYPMNVRSSKQVKEYFGTASSDKPTLTRIAINGNIEDSTKSSTGRGIEQKAKVFTATEQTIAELILKLRKLKNDLSKLAQYKYPKLYGRFNPLGAATSRYTCKGGDHPEYFNAQNFSRDFKSLFGVKEDSGYCIVAADYATLEIRIAAEIMNEPNMHKALLEGADIHKATAALLYNKPLEAILPRERSNAKVSNFGFTYGLSAKTFVQYAFDLYGLKFSLEEATELRNKYFKAYPGIKRYHDKVGKAMQRGGYVCQTALGYKMKPRMYTDAINGPTQGTGAECMRLAIHRLVVRDKRILNYIITSIHDAIEMCVPLEEHEYWMQLLEEEMILAWKEIRKSREFHFKDTPMLVDVEVGYHLGKMGPSLQDLHEDIFSGGGQALSIEEMRAQQERNKNAV